MDAASCCSDMKPGQSLFRYSYKCLTLQMLHRYTCLWGCRLSCLVWVTAVKSQPKRKCWICNGKYPKVEVMPVVNLSISKHNHSIQLLQLNTFCGSHTRTKFSWIVCILGWTRKHCDTGRILWMFSHMSFIIQCTKLDYVQIGRFLSDDKIIGKKIEYFPIKVASFFQLENIFIQNIKHAQQNVDFVRLSLQLLWLSSYVVHTVVELINLYYYIIACTHHITPTSYYFYAH